MDETCIWCGESPAKSLEHIVPDALGCPPDFVLTTGVCSTCNHRNGRLDRALLVPYEIITVMKGVPRKKGRRPTVDGFTSIASSYDANGPVFYINREKHAVQTPAGKWLGGVSSSDPITDASWQEFDDGTANISDSQELRFDRKAVRCLFKIAVEAIAFYEGLDAARDPLLNPAKHFVLEGGGDFRAIMSPDQNSSYDSYFSPCFAKEGFARVYGMTLLGIGFCCDFDPKFKGGEMLQREFARQSIQSQVVPNWPRHLWVKNNQSVDS